MPTHSFKFFAKFIALVLVCLLHVSCDFGNFITPSYDESFESYLDYWSSTCEVGQVNYVSSNVKMSNGPNVSAQNQIEIDVIVINPKEYALLCKSGGGNCFRFQNEAGDLVYTNYSEEMIDPSKIKIKANLTDASEGQTIRQCFPHRRLVSCAQQRFFIHCLKCFRLSSTLNFELVDLGAYLHNRCFHLWRNLLKLGTCLVNRSRAF